MRKIANLAAGMIVDETRQHLIPDGNLDTSEVGPFGQIWSARQLNGECGIGSHRIYLRRQDSAMALVSGSLVRRPHEEYRSSTSIAMASFGKTGYP
ncbi:MAG: hypothetical protein JOY79_09515 [Acidobacteriaceae bacterium]|nr:hypothetical protein [Acidobacteriaceae bacterium]